MYTLWLKIYSLSVVVKKNWKGSKVFQLSITGAHVWQWALTWFVDELWGTQSIAAPSALCNDCCEAVGERTCFYAFPLMVSWEEVLYPQSCREHIFVYRAQHQGAQVLAGLTSPVGSVSCPVRAVLAEHTWASLGIVIKLHQGKREPLRLSTEPVPFFAGAEAKPQLKESLWGQREVLWMTQKQLGAGRSLVA